MRKRRFWEFVDKSGDCWLWTAQLDSKGYGRCRSDISRHAHRVAYMELVGPIPKGLVLDHLCRNRACVNPAHLEPVMHRENILRGEGLAPRNAAKTHCPSGHEYTAENTTRDRRGCRICRACTNRRVTCPVCGAELYRTSLWRHGRSRHGMGIES